MYNYSATITEFEADNIRLGSSIDQRLTDRRNANRNRLIYRLGDYIPGVRISESSFKVQGSRAHKTTIQTKFTDEEYDIDDGLLLKAEDLIDRDGNEMGADDVKDAVRRALKDKRFKRQPKIKGNCVRVFYAEEDKDKHHIDFPTYRIREEGEVVVRELAGIDGWVASDPTQVYNFFENEVQERNKKNPDKGSQMRVLNRLLKRFCRSRLPKENGEWDMPNGMKLLMLIAETQPSFSDRIDEAFYNLLVNLKNRLVW